MSIYRNMKGDIMDWEKKAQEYSRGQVTEGETADTNLITTHTQLVLKCAYLAGVRDGIDWVQQELERDE